MKYFTSAVVLSLTAGIANAAGHAAPMVVAADQSVSEGTVTAEKIVAPENGWLVVHRTDADRKPGLVIGHAPIRAGENTDIAAILTEEVQPGDMLMLMVHAEKGGFQKGIFEYTLGAPEDGPVRVDGNLVMAIVTAQ